MTEAVRDDDDYNDDYHHHHHHDYDYSFRLKARHECRTWSLWDVRTS